MNAKIENRSRRLLSGLLGVVVLFWIGTFAEASQDRSDKVTIACVSFNTDWGNKEHNLERIKEFVSAAAERSATAATSRWPTYLLSTLSASSTSCAEGMDDTEKNRPYDHSLASTTSPSPSRNTPRTNHT